MTHPAFSLDLRDLMDARYGVGNWTERTGIGVGTDIGPAIADGCSLLRSSMSTQRGEIRIPPGYWLMTTSPGDLSGVYVNGVGSMASRVIYNNASGAAWRWGGVSSLTGGGISGVSTNLESGLGNTNAYCIYLQGDATNQPDQMVFEDLYNSAVNANSYWWEGFHLDGSARTSPKGIRIGTLTNVQIFNCRNVPLYMDKAVGWTLNNVGVFTGTGTYGNHIIINGSDHVHGMGVNFGGGVLVSGSTDIRINGTAY